MDLIRLQHESFDVTRVTNALGATHVGAIISFVGTVKDEVEAGQVDRIEFTTDEPMALTQMTRLRDEVGERFDIHDAAIVHRLGMLEVGEPIVITAVSAAHGAEGFRACLWLIDNLKERVPIWKREFTPDGQVWVGSHSETKKVNDGGR